MVPYISVWPYLISGDQHLLFSRFQTCYVAIMRGWSVASTHCQDPEGQTILARSRSPDQVSSPRPSSLPPELNLLQVAMRELAIPDPPAGNVSQPRNHEQTLYAVLGSPREVSITADGSRPLAFVQNILFHDFQIPAAIADIAVSPSSTPDISQHTDTLVEGAVRIFQ